MSRSQKWRQRSFLGMLGWNRKQATVLIGIIMLVLGSLSALGYGPLRQR